MIGVVIADDHAMVRAGLRAVVESLSDCELLEEAETGEQAIAAVVQHRPALVVMDLHMPGCGGLEAIRRIRRQAPDTFVLVLTMDEEDAVVFAALRAGARGYLAKGAGYDEVAAAIRAAGKGEVVFGSALATRVLEVLSSVPADVRLTSVGLSDREAEVLRLLVDGRNTDEIAHRLHLSPKTVRNHVSGVMAKLGVTSRADAVAWARAAGNRPPAPP